MNIASITQLGTVVFNEIQAQRIQSEFAEMYSIDNYWVASLHDIVVNPTPANVIINKKTPVQRDSLLVQIHK